MVFQAPRQPVALQQVNIGNRRRVALQRSSDVDNDPATARRGWDDPNHNLYSILYFTTSSSAFSVVRRFEEKTREDGVGHGQDVWAALREKFDGCSREALRAPHREIEKVKMRPDEDPDDFLYKKNRCRDRLNSVTPKEAPSDSQYEASSCNAFYQSTTKSAILTFRGRIATLQTFGG